MPVAATPIVLEVDPADVGRHRFGLTQQAVDRLRDRVVWITGAGTGYGRVQAVALALLGARVLLSGRRREKLDETIDEARRLGADAARLSPRPLDLDDRDAVVRAAKEVVAERFPLVGLVHDAALPPRGGVPNPLVTERVDDWERLLRLNLHAPWQLTRECLPAFRRAGTARVLALSSGAGWSSTPGFGPYNVSKVALNSLFACFARELATSEPAFDAQINVLEPGEARTEMNQGSTASPWLVVPMTLRLLAQPRGGPTGRFFHRDGRHLAFLDASPWERVLA